MSSKQDRIIHIVVVGVSGPEILRGAVGVGKSSLCNRFVRHLADEYQPEDHISTISQSDFSGRVINNDHFLYWGNVSKRNEDGAEVHFSIIEQTEFVDDQSFAPLRGSNTSQYHKRCAVTKLTSAEKLMYICKYQLGEEDGYEKKVLPEPKFVVDGYIMVFDVNSRVKGRPIQKQLEFLGILYQAIKRKPILVVATKCDEADEHYLKEARTFAAKIKTNIVETSSHEAVNVDLAFMTLAQMVDKTKGKLKEVPFSEAIKVRKELLDRITDSYTQLLKRDVTDYHALWNSKSKTYQKTSQPYIAYVKHLGTASAKKLFERHRKKLKEEHLRKKQLQYLTSLPKALADIFPNLGSIGDRTWEDCKQNLNEHLKFQQWFVILDEEWKYSSHIDSPDAQIPYDFLDTNNEECKNAFNKHLDALVAAKRKERMKAEFRKLLGALKEVVIPGRKIEDTFTHLADEESFRELTAAERKTIYDSHQDHIKKRATLEFMEMLYERAELFERFENMDRGNYVDEAREVEEALQSEKRYQALCELKNERIVLLYKHIAFMHNPTKDTCPSKDKCMDTLIQTCIEASVPRSPVRNPENKWSDTNSKLNVVLLGEDGLADQLANEIRAQSCDDDYTLDGALHSLDLRCIEGDVTKPHNHLVTDHFNPQGCICTFTSPLSFQYVKTCLEMTLLASNNDERNASLRNLPVVLMYARDVSVPDSDLWHLKEDANKLQERLNQCMVVEMPTEERVIWAGKKFHESQIQKAFRFIVTTKKHSEGLENNDGLDEDEPDLRIGMALMCGDQFLPDLVLGPLLGHDSCFQTPDLEQSITVDMFLGTERKKLDVDVMSYHQNTLYRDDIHHGYILVYSTKRKASFETMKNFLETIEHLHVPTLIVGVYMDKEDYETQILRLEGHKLAESKEYCKFMPAGPQIQGQPLAYSVFLKEVYDKRIETEDMYEYVPDVSGMDLRMAARTPSLSEDDQYALPHTYKTPDSKVSTLPGYDSENVYDSFNRPSPFMRTPMQSVPIKGNHPIYGQVNKTSQIPRRHSDVGDRPLEGTEESSTPSSSDDESQEHRGSHKRSGSHGHVMSPPGQPAENVEGELYAQVDKTRKPAGYLGSTPENASNGDQDDETTSPVRDLSSGMRLISGISFFGDPIQMPSTGGSSSEHEGWADNSIYDSAGLPPSQQPQRRSLPPDDPNALYAEVPPRMAGDGDEQSGMTQNPIYDSVEQQQPKKKPPPIKPKPQSGLGRQLPMRPGEKEQITDLKSKLDDYGRVRHTSSDSDSRSSMDAIAREPNKRKRSVRRRKVPRIRAAQFEYEPGIEKMYEPMPLSPAAVDPTEELVAKKQSKEEKHRLKKEEKRQRKLKEHQAREQAKLERLRKKNRKPVAPPPQQKPKGPPIETLVTSGTKIPPFVVCCAKYIEDEGKRVEGVYRVPGKGLDSDALAAKFEEDNSMDIADMEISVHAVATALKSFFSQLPEPLVPRATQEEFLNRFRVIGNENFRSALPELMNKLPEVNRDAFAFMMLHLNQIMQHSDVNRMTAENLSTCWWPTLLQPQYKSLEDMANHAPLQNVVITCIQDAPELFGHMEFFPPPLSLIPEGEGYMEDDRPEALAESDASMTVEE